MGSQYIPPPEQNVVNVGDEISVNALNGIAQANPAITSTNPVATNNSVATAVSGKANTVHSHAISDVTNLQTSLNAKADLSGATFAGKINLPTRSSGGISYLNLGDVPDNLTVPTTLVEGDVFFHDSDATVGGYNVRLAYTAKSFGGPLVNYSVAVLQNQNFFTQPNTISCSHNSQAALRITQLGTGEAFRVEDSTTPDATAFVISNNGKVGIGVAPDANAAIKVDSGGLMFNDGTVQTSAAQSGYLKAFVAFNGSFSPPTVTILAGQSFGVSSVVKNSTGNYTINFSSTLPNQYYIVSINGKRAGFNEPVYGFASSRSNSSVTIQIGVGSFTPVDADQVDVSIISI